MGKFRDFEIKWEREGEKDWGMREYWKLKDNFLIRQIRRY